MNDFALAGCVILYNPEDNVVQNIESYIKYLDMLYVVDNSNGDNIIEALLKRYNNIEILKHNENMGIAFSLNEVLEKCQGVYTHLLTMDQDSCFTENSMSRYVSEINKFKWDKILGIAPQIIDNDAPPYYSDVVWKKTLRVITSGNIINVVNAIKIGGFDENLFIDEVDHDFCYRGYLKGFACYVCAYGICLKHSLGNMIEKPFIYRTLKCMNHNHISKYYIVRNRMYVWKKYRHINQKYFLKHYIIANSRLVFDILFFEEDKFLKLKYSIKGFTDFLLDKMGKRI